MSRQTNTYQLPPDEIGEFGDEAHSPFFQKREARERNDRFIRLMTQAVRAGKEKLPAPLKPRNLGVPKRFYSVPTASFISSSAALCAETPYREELETTPFPTVGAGRRR